MKNSLLQFAAIPLLLSGSAMGGTYDIYVFPRGGVDTSIYNNLQPTVKLQTPFEIQMQFQQIQQQRQMMEMQELQMQQMREMQELQRQKRAMEREIKAREQDAGIADKANPAGTWAVVCASNPGLCEKVGGEQK